MFKLFGFIFLSEGDFFGRGVNSDCLDCCGLLGFFCWLFAGGFGELGS